METPTNQRKPQVFLSYSSADKDVVERIATRLRAAGITSWRDRPDLSLGLPWVDAINSALKQCASIAVFIGPGGLGPWQREEANAALIRQVQDPQFCVIPVLLPGSTDKQRGELSYFLQGRTGLEFPEDNESAVARLASAIQALVKRDPVIADKRKKPYRGLRTFEVDDADIYFGRESLTETLLRRLERDGPDSTKFQAILGPSGSGKSSLARAGLLAALKAGKLPGSDSWPQLIIRPGSDPLETLAFGLWGLWRDLGLDPLKFMTDLVGNEKMLHLQIRAALPDPAAHLVLLVDQAEELFSLCTDEVRRKAFLDNLTYAVNHREGRLLAIVAMRADFYPHCASYHELASLLSRHQLLVSPMTSKELQCAIEIPAKKAGRPLDPGLVEQLKKDVANRSGALPLLQHTLEALWELPNPSPGIAEYLEIGGVAGALNARAELFFNGLTAGDQPIARQLFLRLVHVGEGTEYARRRVPYAELTDEQRRVSIQFAAEPVRLLVFGCEGEEAHVELAHEALIREWNLLATWLSEDRDVKRAHQALATATAEWKSKGRIEDLLYPQTRLNEVDELLRRVPTDEWEQSLNADERHFLKASRQKHKGEEIARQEELWRRIENDKIIWQQKMEAEQEGKLNEALLEQRARDALKAQRAELEVEKQCKIAEEMRKVARGERNIAISRRLTAEATAKVAEDPASSLSLLKDAARHAETEQLFAVLGQLAHSPLRAVARHAAAVRVARFSPDGRRVVTASDDRTARVWDAQTGELVAELKGHKAAVRTAEFDPGGERVVTASEDHTARIWAVATGLPKAKLEGHAAAVVEARFSPDGQRIVTASDDHTARIWSAAKGSRLKKLEGHGGPVRTARFGPDGERVVTAGADCMAWVWDAKTGSLLWQLNVQWGEVAAAEFSPDGKRIVTASEDNTARVWSAETGEAIRSLTGHTAPVNSARFSPDGRRIVTASSDTSARVWDAQTGSVLAELEGHSACVNAAEFSPDGRCVLTASADGTARAWDAESGACIAQFEVHGHRVNTAGFSPDGWRIVTASDDGAARVWEPCAGAPVTEHKVHAGRVNTIDYSPDARRVVTASEDMTAMIWDANTASRIGALRHDAAVAAAEFSPDGLRVVTVGRDHTARVWDAEYGFFIAEFAGHQARVNTAEFSRDGRHVVTASDDHTARVWQVGERDSLIAELKGHAGPVNTAEFRFGKRAGRSGASTGAPAGHPESPEDAEQSPAELVLTASSDHTARIWNVENGSMIELAGHTGPVNSAEFSPDGRRVVTASDDHSARVWDAETGSPIAEITGHTGPVTAAEFDPEGQRVVTASADCTARVWDAKTGSAIELRGHAAPLRSARFSPDGLRVVTASEDHTVRVWDAKTGSLLSEFADHPGQAHVVLFAPDGRRVVTAGVDGSVRVWRDDPSWWPRERQLKLIEAARDCVS